jgi:hypothetical protein
MINIPNTVLQQNYFQYNNEFFKPLKVTAMESPLSKTDFRNVPASHRK